MEYRLLVADGGHEVTRRRRTIGAPATGRSCGRTAPATCSRSLRSIARRPARTERTCSGSSSTRRPRPSRSDPTAGSCGFDARPPWGTHPTIAPELVDGVRLLQARRARAAPGTDVRTAIPEVNRTGLTALENLGWRDERWLTRMVRGAPIEWLPEAIWGQFNYAIG